MVAIRIDMDKAVNPARILYQAVQIEWVGTINSAVCVFHSDIV